MDRAGLSPPDCRHFWDKEVLHVTSVRECRREALLGGQHRGFPVRSTSGTVHTLMWNGTNGLLFRGM